MPSVTCAKIASHEASGGSCYNTGKPRHRLLFGVFKTSYGSSKGMALHPAPRSLKLGDADRARRCVDIAKSLIRLFDKRDQNHDKRHDDQQTYKDGADCRGTSSSHPNFKTPILRMEVRGDDGSPDQRPQERFAHQIHQVCHKQNESIEDERGASIASELIAHIL